MTSRYFNYDKHVRQQPTPIDDSPVYEKWDDYDEWKEKQNKKLQQMLRNGHAVSPLRQRNALIDTPPLRSAVTPIIAPKRDSRGIDPSHRRYVPPFPFSPDNVPVPVSRQPTSYNLPPARYNSPMVNHAYPQDSYSDSHYYESENFENIPSRQITEAARYKQSSAYPVDSYDRNKRPLQTSREFSEQPAPRKNYDQRMPQTYSDYDTGYDNYSEDVSQIAAQIAAQPAKPPRMSAMEKELIRRETSDYNNPVLVDLRQRFGGPNSADEEPPLPAIQKSSKKKKKLEAMFESDDFQQQEDNYDPVGDEPIEDFTVPEPVQRNKDSKLDQIRESSDFTSKNKRKYAARSSSIERSDLSSDYDTSSSRKKKMKLSSIPDKKQRHKKHRRSPSSSSEEPVRSKKPSKSKNPTKPRRRSSNDTADSLIPLTDLEKPNTDLALQLKELNPSSRQNTSSSSPNDIMVSYDPEEISKKSKQPRNRQIARLDFPINHENARRRYPPASITEKYVYTKQGDMIGFEGMVDSDNRYLFNPVLHARNSKIIDKELRMKATASSTKKTKKTNKRGKQGSNKNSYTRYQNASLDSEEAVQMVENIPVDEDDWVYFIDMKFDDMRIENGLIKGVHANNKHGSSDVVFDVYRSIEFGKGKMTILDDVEVECPISYKLPDFSSLSFILKPMGVFLPGSVSNIGVYCIHILANHGKLEYQINNISYYLDQSGGSFTVVPNDTWMMYNDHHMESVQITMSVVLINSQ
jgi:hypothetical protein